MIDGMLAGTKWNGAITYSDTDSPTDYQAGYYSDGDGNGISAQNEGFSQFNSQQMKALHSALSGTLYNQQSAASVALSVASFTNLDISYAGAGNGTATIRVANSNDPGTAYAYYPSNSNYGGDSFFGNFYDPYPTASLKTPVAGNYAWYTYLHEMGHSLGLKHSQETGGPGNVAVPFEYDNSEFTVMSYRSYAGAPIDYIHFGVWGAPQTYMMLDIAALQTLYGADYTVNSGNTTYIWTPSNGNTVINGEVAIAPGANVIFATIWDGGGIDTYDLSAYSTNMRIDLTPGGSSLFDAAQAADLGDGNSARGNIYNAMTFGGSNASLIENVIGGSGNDTITGNDADNVINGGAGDDTLNGGSGSDTASYEGAASGVTVSLAISGAQATGGAGSDTLNSIENLIGSASADTLTGDGGNNAINGGVGGDLIDGGAGDDTMTGGLGDDTFVVDSAGDKAIELSGQGTDTVKSSVTYALSGALYPSGTFIENLVLTGAAAINGTGNGLANTLTGNNAANTLDGLGGADTMSGGLGDDIYIVDNIGDKAIELGGQGTDTVRSSVTYALSGALYPTGTFIENLVLTGAAAINGTGNGLANTLTGNNAANTLDGLGGADTMNGGFGDDTYIVDNVNDVANELNGQGSDTVRSSVTYSLSGALYPSGTYIENLVLTGGAAINGTGNGLANTLTGNVAANTLNGAGGADTMIGGQGNDTYIVDNVGDKVIELNGEGYDTIFSSVTYAISGAMYPTGTSVEALTLTGNAAINGTGNGSDNTLTGNSAANTLNGAGGVDTMIGGAGNDTYIVDNVGDKVNELNGEGFDSVFSSVTYALSGALYPTGTFVEALTLTGSTAINGTGNGLNNVLTGNSGVNTLSGLGGNDRIDGGLGSDTLTGGTGADTFIFSTALAPANIDSITDFSVVDDTIQLASSVFTGLVAGVLDASAFYIGAAAHASTDRIIYNSATGALFFDSDGDGATSAVQFATLASGLALTYADFLVA
ncbi:hypothetical protein NSE01_35590 [Novosphingobium sediminis]|uniref:Peptidase M10 serralysin C-terminal domain-containing protein n=2 Tax=Novosphingobium sediminis TaxID=707214 RepID=A0A512AQ55_9SPHN|nr:hypothetical protein NSE01_35590 [Novosphingobium sediminis]